MKKPNRSRESRDTLTRLAQRIGKSKSRRKGAIVIRLLGQKTDHFMITCDDSGANLQERPSNVPSKPLLELIGKSNSLLGVLKGEKDARTQFLAGGFRVRGDLRYLSVMAVELGFLDRPLLTPQEEERIDGVHERVGL